MEKIVIDNSKCIGCAQCVKDCVASSLYIENGKAVFRSGGCIECGHCYAVCPVSAVNMTRYRIKDMPVTSMTQFDGEELLQAIKSRRTIRQYKSTPVEKEKIKMILEAGRYAPTGSNSQNIAYTILGSKQDEIEKECVKIFRAGVGIGSKFLKYLQHQEIDDNFFFKKAPLVIAVSSSDKVNASLASAYMELEANSLGLGVLYSGFFCICAAISPKIKKALKLPRGHKVVTCLIIGYPDVNYKRIAPRKPLNAKIL